MKSILVGLALLLAGLPALAWNGAGHRLVAAVAWRHLTSHSREMATLLLRQHPDYGRWTRKAGEDKAYQAFLEASTWPDDIRNDPRFFNEDEDEPTLPFPGMADTARHKPWHYVDILSPDGRTREGELDRQLERLIGLLKDPKASSAAKTYALPWLIHLLGDIHQPLHVGSRDDHGGNEFEIENPQNPRRPFTNLHSWWDDLPGPPWLRGERLERAADAIVAALPRPPRQGTVALWRDESLALNREQAYPTHTGSLLPIITEDFAAQSKALANRRLGEAGYRLARLLNGITGRVPRETD